MMGKRLFFFNGEIERTDKTAQANGKDKNHKN